MWLMIALAVILHIHQVAAMMNSMLYLLAVPNTGHMRKIRLTLWSLPVDLAVSYMGSASWLICVAIMPMPILILYCMTPTLIQMLVGMKTRSGSWFDDKLAEDLTIIVLRFLVDRNLKGQYL
ncbi:hypothetical protein ACJX0J_007623, partial [Zea mays]